MFGGLNKLFRNVAALKGKGEFQKRLIKATYSGDSKEPKEKHVLCNVYDSVLIECLKGDQTNDPLADILDRFLTNLSSWSLTTKIYVILHRALQDKNISSMIAHELKEREFLLYTYTQIEQQNYEYRMHSEMSEHYSCYIKALISFMVKCKVFSFELNDIPVFINAHSNEDLFWIYDHFDILITHIFKIMEYQEYCARTRLFSAVIAIVYQDLCHLYKAFYIIIMNILDRFKVMTLPQMKKSFIIFMNFITFTNMLKQTSIIIQRDFPCRCNPPLLFEPDQQVLDGLRIVIDHKEGTGTLEGEENKQHIDYLIIADNSLAQMDTDSNDPSNYSIEVSPSNPLTKKQEVPSKNDRKFSIVKEHESIMSPISKSKNEHISIFESGYVNKSNKLNRSYEYKRKRPDPLIVHRDNQQEAALSALVMSKEISNN